MVIAKAYINLNTYLVFSVFILRIISKVVNLDICVLSGINLRLDSFIVNIDEFDVKLLSHLDLLSLVLWSDDLNEVFLDCFVDGFWDKEHNEEVS